MNIRYTVLESCNREIEVMDRMRPLLIACDDLEYAINNLSCMAEASRTEMFDVVMEGLESLHRKYKEALDEYRDVLCSVRSMSEDSLGDITLMLDMLEIYRKVSQK